MSHEFLLMNKDNVVQRFVVREKSAFADDTLFESVAAPALPLPYGFVDINYWLDNRKACKHNSHLKKIMQQMQCDDNAGFVRLTHAVGINDAFWIKRDDEDIIWDDVSLYRNQFSDVVSKLAFEGSGLYGGKMSSTSPELTCDGSFRKCFRKENTRGEFGSDIYIYKRGSELGAGLEPYCEVLASEIAKKITSDTSVKYELSILHGKLASKCNIFSNESVGYASYSKINQKPDYRIDDIYEYFANIGSEQQLREMLVVDALCFNLDRHGGNYGICFNNDTLEVKGMAPVFDMNLSMLPYVTLDEMNNIGDKLYEYGPKIGTDFTRTGQMAINDSIRERVKNLVDFSFTFRGDDKFVPERVERLELIVRRQAEALLSKDVLRTRDVFFSQKAMQDETLKLQQEQAATLLDEFEAIAEAITFAADGYISTCVDGKTVQMYYESGSYSMTIDFLTRTVDVSHNAQNIAQTQLVTESLEFYEDAATIRKELDIFVKRKAMPIFAGFGNENRSSKPNHNQTYNH